VRLEGLGQLKNPMTSGIEAAKAIPYLANIDMNENI
jgi:hypothetical protein